ncbi:hypothetical protein [Mycobacterium marseillense]|uniref:4Fe-4S Wbl-type domain-containing protein n=1 Tax=Mycobacterium marseillense TaxID=701042 RepID=A0ABM7JB31_9MYCO|nr:hypothetical protein [Mycobacterium marseillense]MCV7404513.1 hypothetical protein [Mycobacterium marseillense]ORA89772.1 hypothetical protein BST31_17510 [Mycobacterium marseillense]BBY10997.1 hypothetical protein MMARJ_17370 [Mycobacterium marseillense]
MTNWATMATLLADLPNLRGARCVNRADLFERTIDEYRVDGRPSAEELDAARAAALRLCRACPAVQLCRRWLDGLSPARRPRGVVAGLVVGSTGLPSKTGATAERDADGVLTRRLLRGPCDRREPAGQ